MLGVGAGVEYACCWRIIGRGLRSLGELGYPVSLLGWGLEGEQRCRLAWPTKFGEIIEHAKRGRKLLGARLDQDDDAVGKAKRQPPQLRADFLGESLYPRPLLAVMPAKPKLPPRARLRLGELGWQIGPQLLERGETDGRDPIDEVPILRALLTCACGVVVETLQKVAKLAVRDEDGRLFPDPLPSLDAADGKQFRVQFPLLGSSDSNASSMSGKDSKVT